MNRFCLPFLFLGMTLFCWSCLSEPYLFRISKPSLCEGNEDCADGFQCVRSLCAPLVLPEKNGELAEPDGEDTPDEPEPFEEPTSSEGSEEIIREEGESTEEPRQETIAEDGGNEVVPEEVCFPDQEEHTMLFEAPSSLESNPEDGGVGDGPNEVVPETPQVEEKPERSPENECTSGQCGCTGCNFGCKEKQCALGIFGVSLRLACEVCDDGGLAAQADGYVRFTFGDGTTFKTSIRKNQCGAQTSSFAEKSKGLSLQALEKVKIEVVDADVTKDDDLCASWESKNIAKPGRYTLRSPCRRVVVTFRVGR